MSKILMPIVVATSCAAPPEWPERRLFPVFCRGCRPRRRLTVGFIYVGPKDDFGYNQSHARSARRSEGDGRRHRGRRGTVPETVDVQKTMESMIGFDGATLLFPTSFGYFDPHILALAPKNPAVRFEHCGGLWTPDKPKNVGSYFGYIGMGVF